MAVERDEDAAAADLSGQSLPLSFPVNGAELTEIALLKDGTRPLLNANELTGREVVKVDLKLAELSEEVTLDADEEVAEPVTGLSNE